ncbi:GATM [Mytilus coruscus]|uniref:Glycine amidinotransferase n=1 Tax=Mytilus coruscus TaxID=42192 RepID=A0A6J8DGE9_MYTCO|nr:GATM [Mytilus coruscus]
MDWQFLMESELKIASVLFQNNIVYASLNKDENQHYFGTGKQSEEHIQKATIQLRFQCNVQVRSPDKIDFTQPVRTPFFSIEHHHGASCPCDTLLVIGNEIIESTMSSRARYFESMAYRTILNDYFENDKDVLWTMASKPTMSETMYILGFPFDVNYQERKDWIQNYKYVINEAEPIIYAPFPNSMVVSESCESSAWLSIKCIRVPYRDSYRFGGSIYCQTSDVRRNGECYNYFPNMDSNIVINVGNHYNSGNGIFVAPVSGVYQFSWTTLTDSSDYAYTELRVDIVIIDELAISLGSAAGTIPASRMTVCKVDKDDHVRIQTTGSGASNCIMKTSAPNSFMGLLLFET